MRSSISFSSSFGTSRDMVIGRKIRFLSVALTHHEVQTPENDGNVRQHVSRYEFFQDAEVAEARRSNL